PRLGVGPQRIRLQRDELDHRLVGSERRLRVAGRFGRLGELELRVRVRRRQLRELLVSALGVLDRRLVVREGGLLRRLGLLAERRRNRVLQHLRIVERLSERRRRRGRERGERRRQHGGGLQAVLVVGRVLVRLLVVLGGELGERV